MGAQLWAIALVLSGGLLGGLAPIYLKRASAIIQLNKLDTIIKNKYLYYGAVIFAITTVMFIIALKGGELSILYPLVGLSYVWVCVYSKWMLKEKMNALKWLGIFLVVLGVSFIGVGA